MATPPSFPVLCDIDGVIWLDHEPIDGSVEAIGRLRRAGHRVLFVTNNSASLVGDHEAALDRIGIRAIGDVVTSSQAAAALVQPGERVLIGGGPGVAEAVVARGATAVDTSAIDVGEPVDAVVVGLRRDIDYRWLNVVSRAVRDGARFIATNDDATYPTPRGLEPGGGTLVAAIATASGITPTIAGKPHQAMVAVVAQRLGRSTGELGDALMIGDRLSTDGAFAKAIGGRFGLVYSGVTSRPHGEPGGVDVAAENLGALVDQVLAPSPGW